eukprot:5385589-Prorocentrum_lima.AAC.1
MVLTRHIMPPMTTVPTMLTPTTTTHTWQIGPQTLLGHVPICGVGKGLHYPGRQNILRCGIEISLMAVLEIA